MSISGISCCSVAQPCPTLCNPMDCSTPVFQFSLSYTISQSLLKFMFIELMIPSNHLIHCHPLLLPPSVLPSIRVFSSESALHIRWLKSWSFSLSISTSNEHSRLISFRIDWFDLLAVQRTLNSLLQHHSWELNHKEGWTLKRWCFRTVVLESEIWIKNMASLFTIW